MTTARDVIAKALADRFDGVFEPVYLEDADDILRALIAAPESVRMELAALLSPGRSMSPGRSINPWRPIETAPKGGSDILLGCFGEVGHGGQFIAFWDDEAKHGTTHRWQTADGIAYHNDLPTHWLPLPAPPSEDKT